MGRRSWLPEGTVAAVVHDTLHAFLDDGSTPLVDTDDGRAARDRQRQRGAPLSADDDLKPWKTETFKVSKRPSRNYLRGQHQMGLLSPGGRRDARASSSGPSPNDLDFEDRIVDVVGLYTNPPQPNTYWVPSS
jgi:hypothetical protein